jgi:hypothetical protein
VLCILRDQFSINDQLFGRKWSDVAPNSFDAQIIFDGGEYFTGDLDQCGGLVAFQIPENGAGTGLQAGEMGSTVLDISTIQGFKVFDVFQHMRPQCDV